MAVHDSHLAPSGVRPLPAPVPRLPLQLRFAVHQASTLHWGFLEDVTGYRAAGLPAIGVWLPKLLEFGEERGAELLADHALGVASLSWIGGFTGCDGVSFRDTVRDGLAALELAGTLKAGCAVAVTGSRGPYTFRHARRLVGDALRQLGDAAGVVRTTLAVQVHLPAAPFRSAGTLLQNLQQALELLDLCQHPAIGLAIDVQHMLACPASLRLLEDCLHWVRLVQLSADGCGLSEGTGASADVRDFIGMMEARGYSSYYDVHGVSPAAWQRDYTPWLRQTRAAWARLADAV